MYFAPLALVPKEVEGKKNCRTSYSLNWCVNFETVLPYKIIYL